MDIFSLNPSESNRSASEVRCSVPGPMMASRSRCVLKTRLLCYEFSLSSMDSLGNHRFPYHILLVIR